MIQPARTESFDEGQVPRHARGRRPASGRRRTAAFVAAAVVAAPLGILPIAAAQAADVTILSNDFEATTDPWVARGATTSVALTPEGHESDSSLLVSGRTDTWHGVETALTDLLAPDQAYEFSAWVRLADGETADTVKFTVAQTPEAYTTVAEAPELTSDAWVEISGTYTMPAGTTNAILYAEATSAETDFMIDDVVLTGPERPADGGETPAPGVGVGLDNDFEAALGAWGVRGSGTATATLDADGYDGTQAALVSGRDQAWNGLAADVTGIFEPGRVYTISAWVKMAVGADPADIRLSIQRELEGSDTAYDTITTVTGVTSSAWKRVTVSYPMAPADEGLLYFETAAGTGSFLVDAITATTVQRGVQLDIPSLQDELPWPIGVAIDERETVAPASTLVTKHFNQITAENSMKPEAIQPTEGVFTFDAADRLVDFAVANDLRVYGHTLVWHSQTPAWFFLGADGQPLTSSTADQTILRDRMKTHIDTVAAHYRETYGEFGTAGNPIVAFDVVNEVIDESQSDGLRRSRWFDVLGVEFIDLAFEYANEAFNGGVADGPVTLFINDYNTELPGKRQAMVTVVQGLLDRGVPVGGMGHQFHVSLATPIAQMKASIDAFATLGLEQAVTELDVGINGAPTAERLVQQGYFYADLFDMFREYPDLFALTLWGPDDSRTWRTDEYPLAFDGNLQAKPAYWGIVDRSELPARTQQVNVNQADLTVGDGVVDDIEWALLPLTPITSGGAGTTGFQLRWDDGRLLAYVQVQDDTDDAGDTVTLFAGGTTLEVARDGSTAGTEVRSTPTGYVVVAELPVEGATIGSSVPFDVRVADGATGDLLSWNDPSHNQENGSALGTAVLVEPVGYVAIPRAASPVTIDGEIEEAWAGAAVVSTDTQVEGEAEGGASATVRALWTDGVLHLLFEVTDDELDKSAIDAYLEDSVEFFVDPANAKSGPFNPVDGHYRVNFDNEQSFGGDPSVIGDNLESATTITETGYIVEASIQLTEPEAVALAAAAEDGPFIGVEFQVNDATPGSTARTSVRSWSDPTGRSYQDTSRWGVGQLVDTLDVEVPVDPADPVVPGDEDPAAETPVVDPAGPQAPGAGNTTGGAPNSGALAITGAEITGVLLALTLLVGVGSALVWYRRRVSTGA